MHTKLLALCALAVAAAAAPARAQLASPASDTAPRIAGGGGTLVYAQPLGDFKQNVDGGGGAAGHLLVRLGASGALALRVDAGFLVYGHERLRVRNPFTTRIRYDVTTTNNIATAGVGPQLMVPTGPVRPYINGSVGLAYFFTQSSLSTGDSGEQFAQTTNLDDANLAYTGGGGFYIPLGSSRHPISLDVGARYHNNGRAEYLTEDSFSDDPESTVPPVPIRSSADFMTYHLGVSVGF